MHLTNVGAVEAFLADYVTPAVSGWMSALGGELPLLATATSECSGKVMKLAKL
jgi:hypothetical protein